MSNRIRAMVMKRIIKSGDSVRKMRGLDAAPSEVTELFEDMLVDADDVTLLALLEYAILDENKHKQGNFTQTKDA